MPKPQLQMQRAVRVDHSAIVANPSAVAGTQDAAARGELTDAAIGDLRSHAEMVGASVRAMLEEVVLGISGPKPRPSDLISRTGLDKTIAGRIIQTMRTPDPLGVLLKTPAPNGLRLFVRAAQATKARAATTVRAEETIEGFEQLLARFPQGRAGLEAAISGWMPETRDQGERAARQWAFKSMSFLLGYQSEVTLGCAVLLPSADSRGVDVVYVSGQFGLRRLRVGEPLSLFGIRYYPIGEARDVDPNPRTLDGRSIEEASCLIEEFCEPRTPRMDMVKTKDQRLFVLPSDEPELNEPVSIVLGHRTVATWQRYSTPDRLEEWQTMLARCPTRVFINDTFIHRDIYPGVEPVVTTHMVGMTTLPARERGPSFKLDEVHLGVDAGWVRSDLRDIGTGEIPRYPEIVKMVFDRIGHKLSDFRTHRVRMNYPVAQIAATRWFKLPEAPG